MDECAALRLLGLGAAGEKTAFGLARRRKYRHLRDHALSRIAAAAKRREHLGDDASCVEARARIELLRLVMIEKTVGQHHRPEFQAPRANAVECAILGKRLHHEGAEAADRTFLDRD